MKFLIAKAKRLVTNSAVCALIAAMIISIFVTLNPVAAVQLFSLFVDFSWVNIAALAIVIIGGFGTIELITAHIYDGMSWKEINNYLEEFDDCIYEPIT